MLAVRSYLLRIELADRPGSLGSLAVALGSVGADILSLDVVERGNGYAIDDLVVELPPGAMPDTLITAAEALNGVRVDSVRPHTGLLEAHRELELLDHVAAAEGATARLQVLVNEAPRVLRVSWCTVLRSSGGELHRLAGSPGAPETRRDPNTTRRWSWGCRFWTRMGSGDCWPTDPRHERNGTANLRAVFRSGVTLGEPWLPTNRSAQHRRHDAG